MMESDLAVLSLLRRGTRIKRAATGPFATQLDQTSRIFHPRPSHSDLAALSVALALCLATGLASVVLLGTKVWRHVQGREKLWIRRRIVRNGETFHRLNGGLILLIMMSIAYPLFCVSTLYFVGVLPVATQTPTIALTMGLAAAPFLIIGINVQLWAFLRVVAGTVQLMERSDTAASSPTLRRKLNPAHWDRRGLRWLWIRIAQHLLLVTLIATLVLQLVFLPVGMYFLSKSLSLVASVRDELVDMDTFDLTKLSSLVVQVDRGRSYTRTAFRLFVGFHSVTLAWCIVVLAIYVPTAALLLSSMRQILSIRSSHKSHHPVFAFDVPPISASESKDTMIELSSMPAVASEVADIRTHHDSNARRRYQMLVVHLVTLGVCLGAAIGFLSAGLVDDLRADTDAGQLPNQIPLTLGVGILGFLLSIAHAMRTWSEEVALRPHGTNTSSHRSHASTSEHRRPSHVESIGARQDETPMNTTLIGRLRHWSLRSASRWHIEKAWDETSGSGHGHPTEVEPYSNPRSLSTAPLNQFGSDEAR